MDNIGRLAEVLRAREVRLVQGSAAPAGELGTVNSDHSLSVASLKTPIPKGDYLTALPLAVPNETETAERHSHTVPSLRPPRPGDRVLVLWAGREPVVVAVVP